MTNKPTINTTAGQKKRELEHEAKLFDKKRIIKARDEKQKQLPVAKTLYTGIGC